jgi:hypothetical protein
MAGRKPNQVRVKAGGEIARGCEGKNAWDATVRTAILPILDMSVLSWEGQSIAALNELRDRLDCDFEYIGYNLSENGFRNAVKRFMKMEQSRLKTRYREGHTKCPLDIEEDQWTRLITYWDRDDHKEKSWKMSLAWGSMKAVSFVGHKRKDGREAEEVSFLPQSMNIVYLFLYQIHIVSSNCDVLCSSSVYLTDYNEVPAGTVAFPTKQSQYYRIG